MLARILLGTASLTIIAGTFTMAYLADAWLLPIGGLFFIPPLVMAITDKPLF